MKIGFFTDSYLPTRHGVQVSIDSFAGKLEEMGHEVYIHAPYSPGYKDARPRMVRLKSVKLIKNPEMRLAFPIITNGALITSVKNKFDIIHAHSPFSLGLLAKLISKYQGVPMVYTHHTDYVQYAKFYLKETVIFPGLAKMLTAWFCNASDCVIAPSEKIKKNLIGYGVKKPIEVLHTGIGLEGFKRTKTSAASAAHLRAKLGIGPDEKVIIFFGRVGKEKNIDFLAESFAKLHSTHPHSRFVIAGTGPYFEGLKKLAKKMGFSDKIILVGWVSSEEKSFYYQMADVFVFASKTDTQGIVILEAMASGLPVVALKDEALLGMMRDGVNGYLVSLSASPSAFAKKVAKLFDDPALYRQFSAGALKTVKDYSEKHQTEKLLVIYRGLIETHSKKYE